MASARIPFRYGSTALKGAVETLAASTPRQRVEILYEHTPADRRRPLTSDRVAFVATIRDTSGAPLGVVQGRLYGGPSDLPRHASGALREAGFGAMAKAVAALTVS